MFLFTLVSAQTQSNYYSQIKQNKRDTNQIYAYNRIAFELSSTFPDSVLYYSLKAIQLSDSLKYSFGLAFAYSNLGLLKSKQNNFSEALQYCFLAEKLFEKDNRLHSLSSVYNNLGNLYFDNGESQKAKVYFKKCLAILSKFNKIQNMAVLENNLGMVFNDLNSFDSAAVYLKNSIALAKQCSSDFALSLAYSNYANTWQGLKIRDSFFLYSDLAEDLYRKVENFNGLANLLLTRGIQLKNAGRKDESKIAFLEAIKNYELFGEQDGRSQAYFHLSELEELKNNSELALEYYEKCILLKDSFNNDDNVRKLTALSLNHDFEQKTGLRKKEQLKKDNETRNARIIRNITIAVVVIVLLLIIFFARWVWKGLKEKKKQQIEILEKKNEIEEKQREIIDSIHYARRIQRALVTSEHNFSRYYNQSLHYGK